VKHLCFVLLWHDYIQPYGGLSMRTVQALWTAVAEEKRRAALLMSQTINDIDA
jgi:hypothetical protein